MGPYIYIKSLSIPICGRLCVVCYMCTTHVHMKVVHMCTLVHDIVICTLYRTCIVVSSIPLCFLISTDQTISTFFFSLHSRSKNKLLFCLRVKLSFFQTVQTDKEMHIYTEIPKHNNKIKYRNLQVTRNNTSIY